MLVTKNLIFCNVAIAVSMSFVNPVSSQELFFDLNNDGYVEQIIVSENGVIDSEVPAGVSTVEIYRGDTGNRLVVFYGNAPNEFGKILILDDITGDDLPDILISRPSLNEVVLLESFWDSTIVDETVHINMGHIISCPSSSVFEFGFDIKPLYDIDSDGITDLQIGAHFLGPEGEIHTRIYLYTGMDLELLAWVDPDNPSAQLPKFPGDSTGDTTVTVVDLDNTIENLGTANANRARGDLNNDSIVDGIDLAQVLSNLGNIGYMSIEDPITTCDGVQNTYRSYIGNLGWACVTTVPYERFYMNPILNETGIIVDIQITPDTVGNLPGIIGCSDEIRDCMNSDSPNYSQELFDAYSEMLVNCGGAENIAGRILVACYSCDGEGKMIPKCKNLQRRVKISICKNNPDVDTCTLIAHELIHVSQACKLGLFDYSTDCDAFWEIGTKYDNKICQEIEAYQGSGFCDNPSIDCCEWVCKSVGRSFGWNKNDPRYNNCADCCDSIIAIQGEQSSCCTSGVWNADTCPQCNISDEQ